ncbi:hypothetical protein [Thauera sp. WH-1]|uniref:hypothetical protein n=1 Tax=Thauera sp. WH-1 TaxID=3398230 RepID=UPI0039FC6149
MVFWPQARRCAAGLRSGDYRRFWPSGCGATKAKNAAQGRRKSKKAAQGRHKSKNAAQGRVLDASKDVGDVG